MARKYYTFAQPAAQRLSTDASKHTLRNKRRPPSFANVLLQAINQFAHNHQSIEKSLILYWISY